MTLHTYQPEKYYLSYEVHPPALTVQPGDTVSTLLVDAHGFDRNGQKVTAQANPLTGPFVIDGSQPGDFLAVTLETISPNRRSGWASQSFHPNLHDYSQGVYQKEYIDWELDLDKRIARPLAQPPPLDRIELPFAQVLGCIGVAPGSGIQARSIDCGFYGGNMDLSLITAGVTLYFPVNVPGGYLFLGDGHAVQSDGEITGNGIEVSCDIRFSIELLKSRLNRGLTAENPTHLIAIANEKPLDKAFRSATEGMARWLEMDYSFPPGTSGLLMGQAAQYKVGNLVSNLFTVACTIDKRLLVGL